MKVLSEKAIREAIETLNDVNVPTQNRLFYFDETTPMFKKLKQSGRIIEIEPHIWEIRDMKNKPQSKC